MQTELDLSLRLRCATDPILTSQDNVCVCVCVCVCAPVLCEQVRQTQAYIWQILHSSQTVKHCDLAGFSGRAGTCPSLAENAWFVNDLELAETR